MGKRRTGWTSLWFVLGAFAGWFLFAELAEIVVRCVPGGSGCAFATWPLSWKHLFGDPSDTEKAMTARHWAVLSISLIAALWVSSRIFFRDDFDETVEDAQPAQNAASRN